MSSQTPTLVTTGSCSCGKIEYAFRGQPLVSPDEIEALCHCLKCKRGNGSSFSTNLIVPAVAFELTRGEPAKYTSRGESGKDGSSHFCRDCGSPLFVTSELAAGVVIVKAGTLDKWELAEADFKPTTEMFCATKYNWLSSIEGVIQLSGAN